MTESSAAVSTAPAKPPSFWEDVIDIFFQPADVFRRRQTKSMWPPLLFVAIAIGVISYFTFAAMQPIIDAEFARGMAKAMAKNPQFTQEMADKMRATSESIGKFVIGPTMLIIMLVLGLVTWLLGKLVGAKQTLQAAMVVAAWAYFPRIIGAVISGAQALFMDPSKLTSQMSVSLSPARFLDPDASNQLLFQFLGRLDLITIWVTVLLAIGLCVT
ncbi:MAG: Yip1 family protein, partial [Gemmatimonadaceae bacterium]